jgi:hypothetical protein
MTTQFRGASRTGRDAVAAKVRAMHREGETPMQKPQIKLIVQFAAIAAFAAFRVATRSFAQEPVPPQTDSTQGVEPWTRGTRRFGKSNCGPIQAEGR